MDENKTSGSPAVKKRTKVISLIAGGAALLIAVIVLSILLLRPAFLYNKGKSLFESGRYAASAEKFLAAGDYKDAASRANIALSAQDYADGAAAFESEDYETAVACFQNAGNYEDAAERTAESMLGVHYQKAEKAYQEGDYPNAILEFKEAGAFRDAGERVLASTYAMAKQDAAEGNYQEALDTFVSLGDYGDCNDQIFEIGKTYLENASFTLAKDTFALLSTDEAESYRLYAEGMEKLDEGEYLKAKSDFLDADVEDSADMAVACDYLQAEFYYQDGSLNSAKELYETLPRDYGYQGGVQVGDRLDKLEAFKGYAALCGKWNATANYIESKNVYRRTGSWSNWAYSDTVLTEQNIIVKCVINEDDTVTVNGEVMYYRFDDYSSLREYCKASSTTKKFSIQNITAIPASFSIDVHTTLKYEKNVFRIYYYVKDEYSASFYNTYTSDVTYGKLSVAY